MVGMGASPAGLIVRCGMVLRLQRLHEERELHFVTFSCWHRLGYLAEPAARDLFEEALEGMQARYCFAVLGYVVMPEHVHLYAEGAGAGVVIGGFAVAEAFGGEAKPAAALLAGAVLRLQCLHAKKNG